VVTSSLLGMSIHLCNTQAAMQVDWHLAGNQRLRIAKNGHTLQENLRHKRHLYLFFTFPNPTIGNN